MSQIVNIADSAPVAALLAAAVAGLAVLVIIAGLVATLSRAPERRDAAFRVLDRLLVCLPSRSSRTGSD